MNRLDGVIDVKDLFAELVRKSWIIILCAVLFAGALGTYAFMQNKQDTNNKNGIESTMEDEELDLAKDYVMSVLEFYNLEDYMENSIMMTCNPYNLYQTELKYVISGDVDESDIATMRVCYENYVLYGSLISDIANVDKNYAGKVLLDAITIDTESKTQTDTSKIVSILIYAIDEEQSQDLVALVKEQVEAYSKEVAVKFDKHELELLSDNTIQTVADELIEDKDACDVRIERLEAEMETLGGQLSPNQKEYAVEILKKSLGEKALKELKIEEIAQSGKAVGVIKYAVLGGVVGFAMAAVLIIALYFFTNQVKSEKELEHLYGIKHVGNCSIYKRNFFDKLADRIFYKNKKYDIDDSKAEIVGKLVEICKENQIKELGFLGRGDDKATTVLHEICEKIEESGVKSVRIDELCDVSSELPRNIVCVEILKKTSMQDVITALEECGERNITVCGYITFSK